MSQITKAKRKVKFTQIPNKFLQDKTISAKAKGILCYILSLPDEWTLYKTELHNHFKEGQEAISNGFEELVDKGYIIKVRMITGDKPPYYNYMVYDEPQKTQTVKSQTVKSHSGKPVTGNPVRENRQLLNTIEERNTIPINTIKNKEENFSFKSESIKILELIKEKGLIEAFKEKAPSTYQRLCMQNGKEKIDKILLEWETYNIDKGFQTIEHLINSAGSFIRSNLKSKEEKEKKLREKKKSSGFDSFEERVMEAAQTAENIGIIQLNRIPENEW